MQVPYAQVTDEQIRNADAIFAFDPRTEKSSQLYGQHEMARIRLFPAGPYTIQVLDVEIGDGDEQHLREFGQRIARVKNAQKTESARELARKHYQTEAGLTRIIRFSGAIDVGAQAIEPIKLLEVNENTVPSGVLPLGFDAAPASGIHFPSVIIEVTPGEFERIQTKELKLPRGWEYRQEELPKPVVGSGQE